MPWIETCAMEERKLFIRAVLAGQHEMAELCRVFGISRKTGYKWWARFQEQGQPGLSEVSRAPAHHPNAVSDEVVRAVIEARRAHPRWGARKLVAWLERRQPERSWPAPSTVGEILRREGLVCRRKRRSRTGDYTSKLAGYYGPNAVWCADFKGQFKTLDHRWCYPLTISDGFSRFLLRCEALAKTDAVLAWPVFDAAFCEYGLPDVMRTDNGVPFSSTSGLSALAIWWVKLGIRPERITPGRPTQNGRHERIHRTMLDELSCVPAPNRSEQQRTFDCFRREYNEERPHEALDMQPPSTRYAASTRRYPTKLRQPEYPDGYRTERIEHDGFLHLEKTPVYVSRRLVGEPVGIKPKEDGTREVFYGPLFLGTIDAKGRLIRGRRARARKHGSVNADFEVLPMSPV